MDTRRPVLKYILSALLVIALAIFSGCSAQQKASNPAPKAAETVQKAENGEKGEENKAEDARQKLIAGNYRFVSGTFAPKDLTSVRREDLKKNGQKPFAVIVSCSDSRLPPELIFDQALGDIFVVRVAGNVVDPVAVGSVEYGVEHLGAPLIVVLGHEKCGAVKATVDGGEAPGSIGAIVEKIKPSVDKAKATGVPADQLAERTADLNVEAVMADLEKSPIIKHLIEKGEVKIVGAKYHIGAGTVQWFNKAK